MSQVLHLLVPQLNKLSLGVRAHQKTATNVCKIDLHTVTLCDCLRHDLTTPTHSVDIDGRQHVLEDSGHEVVALLLVSKVAQSKLQSKQGCHMTKKHLKGHAYHRRGQEMCRIDNRSLQTGQDFPGKAELHNTLTTDHISQDTGQAHTLVAWHSLP